MGFDPTETTTSEHPNRDPLVHAPITDHEVRYLRLNSPEVFTIGTQKVREFAFRGYPQGDRVMEFIKAHRAVSERAYVLGEAMAAKKFSDLAGGVDVENLTSISPDYDAVVEGLRRCATYHKTVDRQNCFSIWSHGASAVSDYVDTEGWIDAARSPSAKDMAKFATLMGATHYRDDIINRSPTSVRRALRFEMPHDYVPDAVGVRLADSPQYYRAKRGESNRSPGGSADVNAGDGLVRVSRSNKEMIRYDTQVVNLPTNLRIFGVALTELDDNLLVQVFYDSQEFLGKAYNAVEATDVTYKRRALDIYESARAKGATYRT